MSKASQMKNRETADIFGEKMNSLGSSPCYRFVANSSAPVNNISRLLIPKKHICFSLGSQAQMRSTK